jgi:hypothetical protein
LDAVFEQSTRAAVGGALGLGKLGAVEAALWVELVEQEGVVYRRAYVDFDLRKKKSRKMMNKIKKDDLHVVVTPMKKINKPFLCTVSHYLPESDDASRSDT